MIFRAVANATALFLTPAPHGQLLDESFRPPFSKGGAVEGAQPSSPPQRRNLLFAVLFGSFSCGYIAKKKNENKFLT